MRKMEEFDNKDALSALEELNAAFEKRRKEGIKAETIEETNDETPGESSELDALNAAFLSRTAAAKPGKKAKSNQDLIWNLISGVLIVIIVVAIFIAFFVISRGMQQQSTPGETGTTVQTESKGTETGQADTSSTEMNSGETSAESETVRRTIPAEYEGVLTGNEKKEWESREEESGRLFVQLNQNIAVEDIEQVYLRLINPPYSVYNFSVKIMVEDTVLYESELLSPGTVLEYVPFSQTLEAGNYTGKAEYQIYDNDGNSMGTYEVDVMLQCK